MPTRALAAVLVISVASAVLAGCVKSPLRPDDPRTQFEAYDRSRNLGAVPTVTDEFGRTRPNLRGRLIAQD